jgi:hypothetical protein
MLEDHHEHSPAHPLTRLDRASSKSLTRLRKILNHTLADVAFASHSVGRHFIAKISELECRIEASICSCELDLLGGVLTECSRVGPVCNQQKLVAALTRLRCLQLHDETWFDSNICQNTHVALIELLHLSVEDPPVDSNLVLRLNWCKNVKDMQLSVQHECL